MTYWTGDPVRGGPADFRVVPSPRRWRTTTSPGSAAGRSKIVGMGRDTRPR